MDLRSTLSLILEDSLFLKKIEELRHAKTRKTQNPKFRNLKEDEIKKLKEGNNYCPNWSLIIVNNDFITDYIRNSKFFGRCILGKFSGREIPGGDNISLPTGIYNSIVKNSEIGSECSIESCGIISNYIIAPKSFLFHVNTIAAGAKLTFTNGKTITTGPETGERSLAVFAELTPAIVDEISTANHDKEAYKEFITAYSQNCSLPFGFIGKKSIIKNTWDIIDSYIGEGALISGVNIISGSTILCSTHENLSITRGVEILNSIIQQGCQISSMAIIHDSVIMEYTQIENHSKILSSIIGPNSSMAGGEVISSIAGPFTAAHHQSLLIAALWNKGRGNIGYGANVGSNHTSRLPDQEIHPGEGMFFGLGTNIKFPADYRNAPYSVISTGAVTMPQKIEFPFSLINQPAILHNNLPPGWNELIPAWMLIENIYSIIRNESKYKKRNRSALPELDRDIFRPKTVELMITARNRLSSIKNQKDLYTETDIPGTGKNFITEKNRINAIESYNFFIGHYCLKKLALRVEQVISEDVNFEKSIILKPDEKVKYWNHALKTLKSEKLDEKSLTDNLKKLIKNLKKIEKLAYTSKERDFTRGISLIDDYALFHPVTDNDTFIRELQKQTKIEIKKIKQIIDIIHLKN